LPLSYLFNLLRTVPFLKVISVPARVLEASVECSSRYPSRKWSTLELLVVVATTKGKLPLARRHSIIFLFVCFPSQSFDPTLRHFPTVQGSTLLLNTCLCGLALCESGTPHFHQCLHGQMAQSTDGLTRPYSPTA
jgi:hypothetical protein